MEKSQIKQNFKRIICLNVIIFMMIITSFSYAKYILTNRFYLSGASKLFYFEALSAMSSTDIELVNNQAQFSIEVKNNDGTNFNIYDIDYTIGLSDSSKWNLNISNGTILGNNLTNNTINLIFTPKENVSIDNIEDEEIVITSTSPYKKEFKIPVNIIKDREWDYALTKTVEHLTVPVNGVYKLETYGGQGGDCSTVVTSAGNQLVKRFGGAGGYSAGYVNLNKGEQLYIAVGGSGEGTNDIMVAANGGYNGGGSAIVGSNLINHVYGAGGGATHIAKTLIGDGLLSNYVSNKSDVLIVAGGGGGSRLQANAGGDTKARWGNGGHGGGTTGSYGPYKDGTSMFYLDAVTGALLSHTNADFEKMIGTQDSGYAFGMGESVVGNAGGGSGWYGGYSGQRGSNGEIAYTGLGQGGSGYLNENEITKGIMSTGANRGDGSAKITYVGPNGTSTSDISGKATVDLKAISGYYGDLIDGALSQ